MAAVVTLQMVRSDHAFWNDHPTDSLEIELAEAIALQPPATVFTWNDDLARYLSFHLGLDRTTAYERSRNEGLVRNRFDATGQSLVEAGSLVIIAEEQDAEGLATAAPPTWRLVWTKPGVVALYQVPDSWSPADGRDCPALTYTCVPAIAPPNAGP